MRVHAMLVDSLRHIRISAELLTCDREDKTIEQGLYSEWRVGRRLSYGIMSLYWPIGE